MDRTFTPSPRLMSALFSTASLGLGVFLAGMLLAPERAWGGYLMAFCLFTFLAVAGPLFLSIAHLSDARWALPLWRIPAAMGATLPAALALGIVLLAGTHSLYEWSHGQVVASDPLLQHKAAWLNVPGFALRLVAVLALWILLARRLGSLRPGERGRNTRVAALFLAVFAVTFSVASVDWIQSLEPHWFSTIFALHTLATVGLAGVATCILVLVALRRQGRLRDLATRDVLEDLAKILMGLSLFWAYIWYCQYMILWYTNIPEEIGHHLLRGQGDWRTLVRLDLLVGFAAPFLALMLRSWRRDPVALSRIAWLVLAGRALDLFVMIAPPLQGPHVRLGVWELGPLAGAAALFVWLLLRALARAPLADPAPGAPARVA